MFVFVLVFIMVMMMVVVIVLILIMMMLVVMAVVMTMVVRVDVELGALDICLFSARRVQMKLVQAQFLQFILKLAEVNPEVEHRADKHVAADPAEHIKVKRLHSNSPAASALIWLAANPAPKPLLMFTTVKPLPQLLSIANSAANPPKLVP